MRRTTTALHRRARFALATSSRFERTVEAVPLLQAGARRRAGRYLAAVDEQAALRVAGELAAAGFAVHLDRFGELVAGRAEARAVGDAYVALAARLTELPNDVHLALDPSNLGLDVDPPLFGEQLDRIAAAAPAGRTITVGAEDAARTDPALEQVLAAAARGVPVTMTLQAALRRSPQDAERLAAAGVPVRLVKGAYVESSALAHPYGPATDAAYATLAAQLVAAGAHLRLGTHDPVLHQRLLAEGGVAGVEMLLGVRGPDAVALRQRGIAVGLYVPYGQRWFRYLMRRRAEAVGA